MPTPSVGMAPTMPPAAGCRALRLSVACAEVGQEGTAQVVACTSTGIGTSDKVLSQVETTYEDGNAFLVTDRERNHDKSPTATLGQETTTPKARRRCNQ